MKELSLHIMDILQNSLGADAKVIRLDVEEDKILDILLIRVEDDGKGMTKEELKRVQDPFYTTKREIGVGLGIPMFKWSAEHCDGSFAMESVPGKGTVIEAIFSLSHIDRPPLGDLAGVVLGMVVSNPDVRFVIRYKGAGEFFLDSQEIKDTLDGVPITSPDVIGFLKEYIGDGLKDVIEAA